MKALIHEGIVVQIEEKEFPVAPPLKWVTLTNNEVQTGYIYTESNNSYSPPPVIDFIQTPS